MAKITGDVKITTTRNDRTKACNFIWYVSLVRMTMTSFLKAASQPYAFTTRTPAKSSLVNLIRPSARVSWILLNLVEKVIALMHPRSMRNIAAKPPRKLAPTHCAKSTMATTTSTGAKMRFVSTGIETKICSVSLAARLLIMPAPVFDNPTADNRTILPKTAPIMAPRTLSAAFKKLTWAWFFPRAETPKVQNIIAHKMTPAPS
mmetsp:Transcript_43303/g.122576  ORF Transcript_43303/g.122576 Transcript_43303/m.122576 type:complete len:204 (-) Transcript_43303:501-1112(-)